jgi:hypothetical protein
MPLGDHSAAHAYGVLLENYSATPGDKDRHFTQNNS